VRNKAKIFFLIEYNEIHLKYQNIKSLAVRACYSSKFHFDKEGLCLSVATELEKRIIPFPRRNRESCKDFQLVLEYQSSSSLNLSSVIIAAVGVEKASLKSPESFGDLD